MTASLPGLTILALGGAGPAVVESFRGAFRAVERIDLEIPPRDDFGRHSAAINRAIEASTAEWILLLRAREEVPNELAAEIASAVAAPAHPMAFRITVEPWYDGGRLLLGSEGEAEIRLFHRYHCRFEGREGSRSITVRGDVAELGGTLRGVTFRTRRDHTAHLARFAVPHSFPRRCLVFLATWIRSGPLRAGMRGLRYLWIEAGWDTGGSARSLGAG